MNILNERHYKDDLTGKQFGELTVLEPDNSKVWHSKHWLCKCSCGKIVSVERKHLLDGSTKSCGHTKRQNGLAHTDNFNGMRDRQNKYNTNLEVIKNQKMQPNNTSGVKGVDYHKGRDEWRARVHVGGKEITKWFKNKEDAIKWREQAVDKYYKPKVDSAIKAGDLKEDLELSNEYDSEGNQLTKAQVEFFKNSKVRDEKGKLLVCYHGTDEKLDIFDKKKIKSEPGFWFTEYKEYANIHGDYLKECYLNLTNPLLEDKIQKLAKKYFKIRNGNIDEKLIFSYPFRDFLIEDGYDGMGWTHDGKYTYIAFEPNQIKSITNKNPTISDNINESYETINSSLNGSPIIITASAYTISNLMKNTDRYDTILYDDNIGLYFIGKDLLHYDIIDSAMDNYIYSNTIDKNIDTETYFYEGLDNCYFYFIRYIKDTDDNLKNILKSYKEDYFDAFYKANNIIICVKELDIGVSFKDTELYDSLGKPEEIDVDTIINNINEAYHYGNLDYGKKAETRNQFGTKRETGHFGTGFYTVGKYEPEKAGDYAKRGHWEIDLDKYNLFKPASNNEAHDLHDALKYLNEYINKDSFVNYDEQELLQELSDLEYYKDNQGIIDFINKYDGASLDEEETPDFNLLYNIKNRRFGAVEEYARNLCRDMARSSDYLDYAVDILNKIFKLDREELKELIRDAYFSKSTDSVSTNFMKALGYEGVDVTHLPQLDNFSYGSVVYDLKPNTYRKVK